MDKESIERTKSAIERVAIAGSKVILTGFLAIGLLLPEYDGLLHSSDVTSMAPLVQGEQEAFHRSETSFIAPVHAKDPAIAAVPPRVQHGLHDHREGHSIVVKWTSPIIVTGAGLFGQPDLWLNRAQ